MPTYDSKQAVVPGGRTLIVAASIDEAALSSVEPRPQAAPRSIRCPKCKRAARLVTGEVGRPVAVYECNADGEGGCGCLTVDCAGCGDVYTVRDAIGRGEEIGTPPRCPECGRVAWSNDGGEREQGEASDRS